MVANLLAALALQSSAVPAPQQPDTLLSYANAATRALVTRAIARRQQQDSAVVDYRARLRYRLTASVGRRRWGRFPIGTVEELEATIVRLAEGLCGHLQHKEVAGRTIAIKVRLDDWTTVTRARTLDARTNDTETVTSVALDLLRAYAPARPVRLLGVRVAAFEEPALPVVSASPQLSLEV